MPNPPSSWLCHHSPTSNASTTATAYVTSRTGVSEVCACVASVTSFVRGGCSNPWRSYMSRMGPEGSPSTRA